MCKNCIFYKEGICDYAEIDDEDYPNSNQEGFGIRAGAYDDTGLHTDVRVDEDFGCKMFASRYK